MKTQLAMQKFLDNRRAQNLKPKSIAWYEAELKRFAVAYPELPTEPEPVEEFPANIEGVPETKHAYYKALKALYRFIHKRYGLANPIEQINPPRCPRKIMSTLEAREIMQLLNSVDSPRDRALLTLFVDTGARVSELTSLREQGIKEGYIKVRGKRGEREIPISDETRHLLLTLVASNGRGELVFTHPDGQHLASGLGGCVLPNRGRRLTYTETLRCGHQRSSFYSSCSVVVGPRSRPPPGGRGRYHSGVI